ncbi:MAG: hypothetical protein K1X67_23395 [Fimbriimonadaceae bacterium]|nr:hypothetical protein [Fimbriimonadaceae bacterium]
MPAEISLDAVELDVENLETIPLDPAHRPESYPLPMLRRTGQRRVATIRTAVLENAYLRLTFALDLGGRMIELYDKRTGTDILPRLTRLDLEEGGCRGIQTTWRIHPARAGANFASDEQAAQPLPQPLSSATEHVDPESHAGAGEGGGDAGGTPAVRGVGWQVVLGREERPNALGPVDFQIREAEDDDDPVELWMFELVVGQGLSWHQRIVLAPDRAEFALELRLMNRELRTWPSAFGWSLGVPGSVTSIRGSSELICEFPERDAGLWIGTDPGQFRPEAGAEGLTLWRMGPERQKLLPREVLSGAITVVPFSGVGFVCDAGRDGALSVQPERLMVQSSQPLSDHKIVIKTRAGQTMEALATLDPMRIHEVSLPEPVDAAAVKPPGRNPILQWESPPRIAGILPASGTRTAGNLPAHPPDLSLNPSPPPPHAPLAQSDGRRRGEPESTDSASARAGWPRHGGWHTRLPSAVRNHLHEGAEGAVLRPFAGAKPDAESLIAGFDSPLLGGLARLGLAIHAFDEGKRSEGEHLLDEALERSCHDPLLWWFRSIGQRSSDERADLLNAHYLAPLEPMLRAESFLSAPSQDREPSPLVAPLATSPDHLVEIACLLLVHRRLEDAARWMDECLRHRSVPMLHLLMAWSLLEGPGLRAEAANHVHRALTGPPEPPFPWRWIERVALERLHAEFAEQTRLTIWCKLASHG